jgi:5,6-dimethylbenzimidazole synthase
MRDLTALRRDSAALGAPVFSDDFRAKLRQLFLWRRDVRRFRSAPLAPGALERLIDAARLAPSVGLSQPWRFVTVDDAARRAAIIANFNRCNAEALSAYEGPAGALYARLKLAGLRDAPCHLAVFVDEDTPQGHGLGRRTMPEMLRYSVVGAICHMWLAARAEGIGMGWVSIIDPLDVRDALDLPSAWRLIGYFCLGYPEREDDRPELEREGWERRETEERFLIQR